MYRVSKVLNNNGIIAIDMEENQEYVLLGKCGIWKEGQSAFLSAAIDFLYRNRICLLCKVLLTDSYFLCHRKSAPGH